MTRSNAAQEPSMDEILASIRRIIETGEENGAPTKARLSAGRSVERFAPGAEEDRKVVARVSPEATSPGADGEAEEASLPSQDHVAFDLGFEFEDELARHLHDELNGDDSIDWGSLAAAAANLQVADLTENRVGEVGPQSKAASSDEAIKTVREEPDAVFAESESDLLPEQEVEPMTSEAREPAAHAAANSDSARMGEFRQAVLDDDRERRMAPSQPLVSGHTGDLVSASFNELAEAIRHGEMRSLEEMAQEMLRPMLQEWLDDNLPKLVERLVREEIERVARGGRK